MISPDLTFATLVLLPVGLGLFGFIEPCSIGSTLIFVKFLEGKSAVSKLAQVCIFAGVRAVFIGLLGALAVLFGTAFLGLQKVAWVGLGAVYVLIGLLYLVGKIGSLMVSVGPNLARLADARGSAALGVLFGLNIPACAAPLIFALLGAAAASGASGATIAHGFISLALFGFALSLPLVVAVLFEPARRALDWLADLSRRLPFWTGVILIALGLWSAWFGLFATIKA
ncbi:MAG: cytochrome c biogenesis protein CcdA [Candidatus Acidiferrales bacterium]